MTALRTVLEQEALNMTLSGHSPAAREAREAFVEKCPPQFIDQSRVAG